MKNIKTKNTIKEIKQNDNKRNLKYFEKKVALRKKKETSRYDEDGKNQYAINRTVSAGKESAIHELISLKKTIKKKYIKSYNNRKKAIKQKNINTNDDYKKSIIQKNLVIYNNHKKTNQKEFLKKAKKPIFKKSNDKKETEQIKIANNNTRSYINKQISKIKPSTRNDIKDILKTRTQSFYNFNKNLVNVIRKAGQGVSNLISIGIGFIMLVVIVLFIGVFAALGDDSNTNSATQPLSTEVISYRLVIEKYAVRYDVGEYVPLIEAVMMQESGGKGTDPMQSSECSYNNKYSKNPNSITDPEYSIDCGVHYISDCLKKANVKGPGDMSNISLALQGYNFGNGYIDWAIQYFNGYTRANAKVFSDDMKQKLNVSVYGDPDYVEHVLRYYHLGNGDIVAIAKTQVGNVGGKPYWEWYGFSSRVSWCACFVSWCANESGQINVSIPRFSRVEDGIYWYKNKNQWKDRSYIPKTGDIIFFDWENDDDPDHVGIVEKVENNKIYTIEGNSSDECKEKKYSIGSKKIIGYGVDKEFLNNTRRFRYEENR